MGVKCCLLIPRTPFWCFQSTHFNLSIPITIHRDNGSILITFNCLANNDAAFPNEQTIVLDYSVFNITLEDHLGQDRHLVQEIDVIVSSPPRYGQLNNHVRDARNIITFKLVELEQGEIEYQFANQTENDSFSWIFQYGNSSVGPFQLQIPVPEINVHCIGRIWGVSQPKLLSFISKGQLWKDERFSRVSHPCLSPIWLAHKPTRIQFNEHYSHKLYTNGLE